MTELSAEYKALADYRPRHKVRFVTAAALFDGHDAAINIMRRILQGMGAEVIHLGHNRSVDEVVTAALQEDVQGIAVSSYQGGHVEYFKYMIDLLKERGGAHIKVFGGGGGVIVAAEIAELQTYGVTRIFSPEDGQRMGLAGMIGEMMMRCDFDVAADAGVEAGARAVPAFADLRAASRQARWQALARVVTVLENGSATPAFTTELHAAAKVSAALRVISTGAAPYASNSAAISVRPLCTASSYSDILDMRLSRGGAALGFAPCERSHWQSVASWRSTAPLRRKRAPDP